MLLCVYLLFIIFKQILKLFLFRIIIQRGSGIYLNFFMFNLTC